MQLDCILNSLISRLHRDFFMQIDCILNSLIIQWASAMHFFILTGSNNMRPADKIKIKLIKGTFIFISILEKIGSALPRTKIK